VDDLFGWKGDKDPGRRAKRRGMKRVARNSGPWWELAMAAVNRIEEGWVGLGEDVRHRLLPIVGKPHSQNVWGALISHCKRKNLFVNPGPWGQPKDVESHARPTQYLRRTAVRG